MTASRASAEPETLAFDATVTGIDGRAVTLEPTYFYPQGGGQPADRGTIDGIPVEDVQTAGGTVVHTLASDPSFAPDETVECAIDPVFRRYCRRAHTASHVLYGAGRRLLDDLGYGGFGITEEKVRVDFATSTDVDDETLVELERLVNRTVWDSKAVSWETLPKDEALGMEDIAFNTKTEEGIAGETVRVVTVEDWDVAACGGTHVRNTREIGPVSVRSRSNPGEGLTRVEIAVGPPGIERRTTEKRALLAAARAAGTAPADLPDEVARLRDETEDLEATVADLERELAELRVADLRDEVIERDGARWLVGAIDGLDANALGDRAQALVGESADVVALVGQDDRTFLAVAASDEDAAAIVDCVTNEYGGGGGGSARFAQGGGLSADPETVVSFLRG